MTHTQRVLYVYEPAIKAVIMTELDQLVSHGPVRLLIFQEGLTHCRSVSPLCDESP